MISSLLEMQHRMCKDKSREIGKSYRLGRLRCFDLVLTLFELVARGCLRSEDYGFLIVLQGQDLPLLGHDFSEVEVTVLNIGYLKRIDIKALF